jgi:hypothetical protein
MMRLDDERAKAALEEVRVMLAERRSPEEIEATLWKAWKVVPLDRCAGPHAGEKGKRASAPKCACEGRGWRERPTPSWTGPLPNLREEAWIIIKQNRGGITCEKLRRRLYENHPELSVMQVYECLDAVDWMRSDPRSERAGRGVLAPRRRERRG